MSKLSKEKRDKLILTILLVIGVLGALYTFVIGAQNEKLMALQTQKSIVEDKLDKAERLVRNSETIEANLAESQKALAAREADMAPPGYYYWFFKLLDTFRAEIGLETHFILDLTQPDLKETELLPNFPYRSAIFGVTVNGFFHDTGRFLMELENSYPYFRVRRIQMQSGRPTVSGALTLSGGNLSALGSNEKLTTELRIVTLIKPTAGL